MRKKIIIIMLICLLLTGGIFASAYFYNKLNGSKHSITSTLGDSSTIEVGNFDELLIEAYQYDSSSSEYNSELEYSDSMKRKTLVLTSDIILKNDVLVNRDCHINLNSFTLDLNGFDLNIKNQYAGTFSLYNGTIIDSSTLEDRIDSFGQVIIDCPNAVYDFTDLIYDVTIVDIKEVSDEQVCLAAFEFVYANVANTGINNFYDSKYTESTFANCELCETPNDIYCIYTYTDLDLISNYFSYDIAIDYLSSNEDILTNTGRVIITEETALTTLTVTITYGEETLSRVINVHVVKENDYAKAAVSVLIKYLEKYYIDDEYKFSNSILLPIKNTYFNCTYKYVLSNGITSVETNDYFDLETINGYALSSFNSDINTFTIAATNIETSDTYISAELDVLGEASSNIDDNYSYALGIMSSLYGNQITIQNGQPTSSNFSEVMLLTDPFVNGYTRLTSISYDLINNYEGTYQIRDYTLSSDQYDLLNVPTNATVKPYLGQTVFLEATFTFADSKDPEVVIKIPVVYVPQASGKAEGFDAFSPYYVYFNNCFVKETNNFSIESFSIPLEYGNDYPVYTFRIYRIQDDATYEEVNYGELFTVSLSGANTHLLFEQGTTTNITINPYYINEDTTTYYFVYIPIYKDGSGNLVYWGPNNTSSTNINDIVIENILTYEFKSILTVPGIVRYQCDESVITEEFADKDLYALAYEKLYGETYIDQFIYTSMLSRKIDIIDLSSDNGTHAVNLSATDIEGEINSLKGINLLTGTYELTFEGTSLLTGDTLNVTEIEYISEITNLEILNLSSTNIFDSAQSMIGFATGESNNFLAILSALTNLKELYLANNKIFSFADLDLFASLEYVDVTNNKFQSNLTIGWATLQTYLNDMLTSVTNSINGTDGALNVNVFATLEAWGVKVVGRSNNSTELRVEVQTIVDALVSLEYQDKLNSTLPISTIYNQYSTNYATYGLYNTYKENLSNIDVVFTLTEIGFEAVDTYDEITNAYTGTYFKFYIIYSYSCSIITSGTIEYTQNYRITRY